MTRGTVLGLALTPAIIGTILLILGAIHPISTISCNPPANGECGPATNYTLAYPGIAIIVAAIAMAFASSKFRPHITANAKTAN
jgi:hypothetical protein